MIVRINQFDAAHSEQYGGWVGEGLPGPIDCELPAGTCALEILILESDEKQRALEPGFRQAQIRQLLPDVLAALREPNEEIVLRLDGPILPDELLPAFGRLSDQAGGGRFAFSAVQKFEETISTPALGSVRVHLPVAQLPRICCDAALGLERNVRMRAFSVREALVNPLLDIDDLYDERWPEVFQQAGFVLGCARGLGAMHIFSHKLAPENCRTRIVRKLSPQDYQRAG